MQKETVYGDFKLSYQVFGSGEETVICLHGHGRSSDDFRFLSKKKIRVVSIDLFFHKGSAIPSGRVDASPVKWEEVLPVFEKIFAQENIDRFHILAFSQGGRFALLLLTSLPAKIKTFTLIAPDGLNNKSFYNWSSRQKVFRMLFHRWQKKPDRLQAVADLAVKLRLMRPKVRDFVYHFSSDPVAMKRASQTWMAFRKLKPDPKLVGRTVCEYQVPFTIIMGKFDQVIRPRQALLFLRNAGLPEEIVEVENGHDFFKESSIRKFEDLLPF